MKRRNLGLLGLWILVGGCFLVGSAVACPASYVKRMGEKAQGTHLHDKATKVADRYMEEKGFDITSRHADIIRPYVVGTAIVDHGWASRSGRGSYGHSLDKPLDDCVRDSLACRHHSQHFGDGKRKADRETRVIPAGQNLGG